MKEVVVIGGGASGLVSSIFASLNGSHVTILERNNSCGKKILITGNGRCNYWNSDQDLRHYHTNNLEILEKIETTSNQEAILKFFEKLGIIPKIKNGYYYPFSNQASSVKTALLKEIEVNNIDIKTNFLVTDIEKADNKFIIKSDNEIITADSIILATGSKAAPKTGSDGMGYDFLKKFGHSIIPVLPSLVQLKANEKFLKEWDGIRSDVKLSLYIDNELKKEETGEIQLTNYGISGICTFNISSLASIFLNGKKEVYVRINFIPWATSKKEFINFLTIQNITDKKIKDLLEGVLNYKLVNILLKEANINLESTLDNVNLDSLWYILSNFKLNICGTNSFDNCQTCSGGVPLTEINYETMESKLVNNLYIVGELLDVDGECGGYNLGFSFITGMLAGIGVNND